MFTKTILKNSTIAGFQDGPGTAESAANDSLIKLVDFLRKDLLGQ